jgi:heme-degrading monooxygenase HmoA
VIHELAQFQIEAGRETDFETAMATARDVIAQSPGFVSIQYWRGIERPQTYTLLITWETVEDHLVGFRESDLYRRWAALTRPFFAGDPVVEHHQPVWAASVG